MSDEAISKVAENSVGDPVQEPEKKVDQETTETTPEAESEEKVQTEAEAKEEKKNHEERRLEKFMQRAAKAEAERDLALRQLREKNPEPVKVETAPARNQFPNEQAYLEAAVQYEVRKQLPRTQSEPIKGTTDEEARKRYEDFDEVLSSDAAYPVTIPDQAVRAVTNSPLFNDLRYYFTKNPDEAKALYSIQDPDRLIAAVGKIEAKVERLIEEKGKPAKTTTAPRPIKPVTLVGTSRLDEGKLSDSEWFALERKRQIDKTRKH